VSAPVLIDGAGRPVSIGPRLGIGGEGTVYALSEHEVAKIYTTAPVPQRIAKLEALVRAASPDVRTIAAWPQRILRERSGRVTGFTMPRIEGRVSIATAMNPGSRKAAFPQATWGWLIHVSRNLAVAMDAVHRTGVVVGDVNDSNFLVGADSFVRLVDVDSFQVRDGTRVYPCDVGIPTYQPPELFGLPYTGLERTANHDRFGLAVLIFQLVFMGRHPWAGLWKGPEYAFDTGEVIARLPFAFGREAAAVGFRPPANTVRLDWLPVATAELFERAFSKNGVVRPSGAEWGAALGAFEGDLAVCSASAMHRYAKSRGSCPWCALERVGLFLFIASTGPLAPGSVYLDFAAVERRMAEIPALAAVPVPADPRTLAAEGEPLEPSLRRHRRAWVLGTVAALAAALDATLQFGHAVPINTLFGLYAILATIVIAGRPYLAQANRTRRAAMRDAQAAFEDAAQRWWSVANMRDLEQRKYELQLKLAAYRSLPAKYTAERARLEADKPRLQLRAYLDTFLIEDVKIHRIGRKRRATLRSYGIETALDVEDRLASTYIPKFGDTTRGALFYWVHTLKQRFRFDPSRPLDPAILNDLRARENRERSDLERDLRGGPQALRALAEQRIALREGMRAEIVHLAQVAAKARADYRALRRL
jgi:DNA-binding helix-hairpin-helix protein with protein kinase domain